MINRQILIASSRSNMQIVKCNALKIPYNKYYLKKTIYPKKKMKTQINSNLYRLNNKRKQIGFNWQLIIYI